ncbi:MAG: hypothetical protein JNL11_07865 [Bdellovibrionaceae bacterium]|nr:hypothetical protein [Pseudobdellovibrionaceae bacterium]
MLKFFAAMIMILSIGFNSLAQTTGTNTQIHTHESIEKKKADDRQESANTSSALQPNQKSEPTRVDVSSWGLDQDLKFEITNHLLGYSTILETEQTLSGIKITGLVNFAYYNVTKKNLLNPNERSKGRYVFGIESPLMDLSRRFVFWGGIGATMGDAKGLYLDLGLDFRIFSWFKLQGGVNYHSTGNVCPQISVGLVW